MRYQKLGNTDIDVSVIALGTWGLGGGSVWTDRDSTVEDTGNLLDICREYGVNYIDTAPVYGTGASEELLGRALKGRRQDFILQSKCSLNWRNEGGNFHYERDGYTVNNDTRAAAVKKDVDSVIVHYVCGSFPVEETVGALEDLVREGKIRTYGLSNSQPADLAAYRRVGGKVSVVQEFFSILSPFHGREYFEMCRKNNTVFQTYGVLEEGFLTSPAFLDKEFAKTDIRSRLPWVAPEKKEGLRRAFALWAPMCEEYHCSYAALVEAWALSQYDRMSLLVGMRRASSVEDTAKCLDIRLKAEDIKRMEEAVKAIQVAVLDK